MMLSHALGPQSVEPRSNGLVGGGQGCMVRCNVIGGHGCLNHEIKADVHGRFCDETYSIRFRKICLGKISVRSTTLKVEEGCAVC